MQTIEKAIGNRKDSKHPSEDFLGVAGSDAFATFQDNNWETMEIAKDMLLVEYCQGHTFSDKDYFNFRLGVDSVFRLFRQASDDRKARIELEKTK